MNLGFNTLLLQIFQKKKMKSNKTNFLLAVVLLTLAIAARIINHEMHIYNLAPVAALGLFCGAVMKDKRMAFLFTTLAQLVSDVYIELFTSWDGFYGVEQYFTYGGMMLVTLLGTTMKQPRALKVLGYSIAGSAIFFIVSNFGVWVAIEMGKDLYGYGHGLQGLGTTYQMALPFYTEIGTELFKNSFIGDLVGCAVLFGGYALLQNATSNKLAKA